MNLNYQFISLFFLLQSPFGVFAKKSSSHYGGSDDCTDTYSGCSSYVSGGYCSTYFCETCDYPNYCDESCGFCEVTPVPAPTPQPSQFPTTKEYGSECKDTYDSCSSYVSSGYCPTYFCETCPYADYCDSSCGYCEDSPVPAPTPEPTTKEYGSECKDTYDYCSSYVSNGECSSYFCETCPYPDYCDASCGYCETEDDAPPVPAPTSDGVCKDTYEYCDSYVSSGYCETYFCDTCCYSNYCDAACGYCETDDDTPVPAPVPSPTISSDECKDTYDYCSSYVTNGYCSTYFCDTCYYPDYCDASCGFCDSDDVTSPVPAPVPSPVPAPTAAPPTSTHTDDDDGHGGGGRTCFSGQETVVKESGEVVPFSKLVVGDKILSANREGETSYSSVVFLPHGENDTPTTFLEIVTEKMKKLKLTRAHLIQLCSGKLVSAQHLSTKPTKTNHKLGHKEDDDANCIRTINGHEKIKSIRQVDAKGVYTAVTENEFLVVNGIIASPFAASSGLVHAYFNLTDIEEWCSSNNWLVYERMRHPQLIHVLHKESGQALISPSSDCMNMLTNMFEQYKQEPIGWGNDGWGYKGWANPSSLHKNMNLKLSPNDQVMLKGAQLLPPPLASPEELKRNAMPGLITGWELKQGEHMADEEMI